MQSGVAALSLTSAAARVTISARGRQPQVQAHVTAAERRRSVTPEEHDHK